MTKILTFQGGGILGLVSLGVLERLEAAHPGTIANAAMFAGTSTGGIIALCLAAGVPLDAIIALYRDDGETIFRQSLGRRIGSIGSLIGSEYSHDGLHALLVKTLGTVTMDQLSRDVLIPTFRLDNPTWPAIYRRWSAGFYTRADKGVLAVDVAMMTSAAPTFFPSYQGHVDGGLVCNMPSILAVAESGDHGALVLSLGTGVALKYVPGAELDLGGIQWLGDDITSMFITGGEDAADYACRKLLGDRYRIINPGLQPGQDIAMDDWSQAQTLLDFGGGCDLLDVPQWLDKQGW